MFLRIITITILIVGCHLTEATELRILEKSIVVNAPLAEVWKSWTTAEGLSFISEKSHVELRIDGPYEWFLDGPADKNGRRGGQGSRVLAFLPYRMIAFTWTFPPSIPELRDIGETTQVVVFFDATNDGQVRVELYAHGWQYGDPWQRGWDYFDNAWGIVLDALKVHLERTSSLTTPDTGNELRTPSVAR